MQKQGIIIRVFRALLYPRDSRGQESITLAIVIWLLTLLGVAFMADVFMLKNSPKFLEFAGSVSPLFALWGSREWRAWKSKAEGGDNPST